MAKEHKLMELLHRKELDGGHTCNTYRSQEIINFPTRLEEYRKEWLEQWHGDDVGRHEAEQTAVSPALHLVALKEAVDREGGGDSFSLPMSTISKDNSYMVAFLHGRGDFTDSLSLVTKHFTTFAREVGQMKGYEYISHGQGWEIKKVK